MKEKDILKYKKLFNLMKPLLEKNLSGWMEIKEKKMNALRKLKLSKSETKLAEFLLSSPATIGTRRRVYCEAGRNRSDYDSIRYLKGLGLEAEEALKVYVNTIYKMFPIDKGVRDFGGILYCCDVKRMVVSCHKSHGYQNLKYLEHSLPMFFGLCLKTVKKFVDEGI